MPSVVIIINVAGQAPGVPGESRLFDYSVLSPTPPLVTVELFDDTDVDEYFWEFVDKPKGSTAVFSDPTSPSPTFTPDAGLTSTYIIQCTVNDGESRGKIGLAFATERLDVRKLAAGEGPEFDGQQGWVEAYNDFVDKVEGLIIGGNVIGPDPATLRAIATYANTSGNALLDNFFKLDTGAGAGPDPGSLSYRALRVWGPGELASQWYNVAEFQEGSGGNHLVIGSGDAQTMLEGKSDPEAKGSGGTGKIIHEKVSGPWEVENRGGIISKQAHTVKAFYLGTTGTSSGQIDMYVGSVDPNSAVTGEPGSMYWRIDGASSKIYQHRGATASDDDWIEVIAGGGGDFYGPASSDTNAFVIFADDTGKQGANSPIRYDGDTDYNAIQIFETEATTPTWRDVVKLREIGPNGLPGGETVQLGNEFNNTLLESLTDPYIQRAGGVAGAIIWERVGAGWNIKNEGTIETEDSGGDTVAPLTLKSNSTFNGAATKCFVGDRDPNGNVTGNPGDTYTRANGAQSNRYLHRGASANNTDWYNFSLIGGTSLGETWTFNNATSGDPGSKQFLLNNAVQASATAIHFHDNADNGVDFSSVLKKLTTNDSIYIQQGDDPTRYFLATVTGPAVDQTTYVQISISIEDTGTPFADGEKCPARFMFSRTGAGSGTTANVGFYGYRSGGNMTLGGSGVGLEVGLNEKRDDAGGDFAGTSTTNTFTAPTAGRYVFTASAEITINHVSGGNARLYLYSSVHGFIAESKSHTYVGGDMPIPCVAAVVYMDAGETMKLYASQESADNAVLEQQYLNFTGAQIVAV
jgi:hypothetical protein